tara:strand:- start:99 stop:575 length:477 start_codon:yes stop_codon:yes gene_type:complete
VTDGSHVNKLVRDNATQCKLCNVLHLGYLVVGVGVMNVEYWFIKNAPLGFCRHGGIWYSRLREQLTLFYIFDGVNELSAIYPLPDVLRQELPGPQAQTEVPHEQKVLTVIVELSALAKQHVLPVIDPNLLPTHGGESVGCAFLNGRVYDDLCTEQGLV